MEGGHIAVLRDGDMINIDIPKRRIDLLISDKEIKERLKTWKPLKPKVNKGWLARYTAFATSANTGAVLKSQISNLKS
jgi:dihydroxy-acid dehydratase